MESNINIELLKSLTEKLNRRDKDILDSEKMFRGFFENSSAGMCIANVEDEMFIKVNSVFCKWLGYSEEELLSSPILSFISPNSVDKTKAVLTKLKKGIESVIEGFVNEYLHKDGHSVWLKWNSSIPDNNGINYSVCANITTEIQQAIKISKQDKIYKVLTESSHEAICLHDTKGNYIYVSPSYEKLFGYSQSDMVEKNAYDFVLPEDVERIKKESHKPLMKNKDFQIARFRLRHKKGYYVWVESCSKPILENGEITEIRTSTKVITEVIKSEKEAFINREIYEKILHNTRELVKVYKINDGPPSLAYISPSCLEYTGYAPEEHVKQSLSELIHPEDEEKTMKKMLSVLNTKKTLIVKYRGKHKTKGYKLASSIVSPILNEEGEVSYIVLSSKVIQELNNDKHNSEDVG